MLVCVGFNTLRPRQNGRHFADDIFKCIFFNENAWISLRISLKFVPEVRINNIPALVQIMAWRRPGDKPLSKPMMVSLLTHICVTRPQWVNAIHFEKICTTKYGNICHWKWFWNSFSTLIIVPRRIIHYCLSSTFSPTQLTLMRYLAGDMMSRIVWFPHHKLVW